MSAVLTFNRYSNIKGTPSLLLLLLLSSFVLACSSRSLHRRPKLRELLTIGDAPGKIFLGDHFLGSWETKLRIVTKPSQLVSNPF